MMKSITLIPLALMMFGTAWCAAIPQASRYDARVQQVVYNPLNVTVVNTRPGFMTTLVFDSDEAVISARPGFEEAWEATPDANRVNVRPVALVQGAPGADGNTTQVVIPPSSRDWHTNLLVVTTRRLYNVELNVIDDKSPQQPAFQVSYRYPDEDREKASRETAARALEREQKQQQTDIQQALNAAQTPRNWDYLKYPGRDSTRIVPDFAYDDGRFTFVGFSPAKSIPSVTKELNGQEHVVNSSIRRKGNFTVLAIQEVTPRLVLRSGNAVVGLENRGFGKVQAADGATVSPQVDRVEKPATH
ncbi:P-type conjugative transfer protein VirB9 [Pectobacterium aroidearum]|uniref:P-type conjugative transfer protein VirB9 n=2 Tax=Gammaproteobacteria TaxID=1236 RepID=A0ABR5ZDI9_9GAMM|nr:MULTISPECIES: P-type conjugative transfer protein VirB9 [Enterobacterales]MBA5199769.1 P-type conjugative transfer protein VirB9 [Pectobacterium aroidearum]MBA5228239.1 P-type conjugative transfer protein VirB9 [Pectobacterium aroidearum]MBA5232561.1 P-type conjugative transfer protein VirB9 [Pectobacterium aroidearum]MBA5737763.1 P-type conjugative transfer protein VirB9 [Pectobacterium aroidearum]UXK02510.1 P-type conjugative transfer protein VirB9 [Pectobacterium aroidearum]